MPPKGPSNSAAYLAGKSVKPLVVKEAPYTPPGPHEIVVNNHAVAINPVDWFKQYIGNILFGYIKYPHVQGEDLAGEVVEVGAGVTRFRVGDRVLANAVGMTEPRNRSSEGAYQHYTVVRDNLATPIPDSLSYKKACVIPLGASTASVGLFMKDFLALDYPTVNSQPNGKAVIVWAGSSSVGSNGVQLAKAAGYEVFSTSSPKNFEYVKGLGASQVFDYKSPTVVKDMIRALKGKTVQGALAIGNGAAEACTSILAKSKGKKFIAMASVPQPELAEGSGKTRSIIGLMFGVIIWQLSMFFKSKINGVPNKFLDAGMLQDDEASSAIYCDFLPQALEEGKYLAVPEPFVVGHGLEYVQEGYDVCKKGVSAKKVIVTL